MGANGSGAPLRLAIVNHADQLPDRGRTGGSQHVFLIAGMRLPGGRYCPRSG